MEISEEAIARAAQYYAIFAFDEGSLEEIKEAKIRFNVLVDESYAPLTKSALMGGFHRPTHGEFRREFMTQCRSYLKRKGAF